jgi:hypothetical protein
MKNKCLRLLVPIAWILLSAGLMRDLHAQGILHNARVVNIRIDASGKGMVFFDAPLGATPPSCANSYNNALAFDANTAGGKAILAVALSAKADGTALLIVGSGACSIYGGYLEDWSYNE